MASSAASIPTGRLSPIFQDKNTIQSTCKNIASEVQSGQIKLCEFIEELGPFVTNKDINVRETGIAALSSVLSQIPKKFLNESELQFITMFYCDRLKDHHSIIPVALQGILAIVQMDDLPQDASLSILRVIFEHVSCQTQPLSDRRNIYLILRTLVWNRSNILKTMGPDFVYGFISVMDGERDPRNLMLLFNVLPSLIREFPLGHLKEDMFDVISCYFPIDFRPHGLDVIEITREDLSDALAPCLCAIPDFAEFCMPLIIQKLSSSIKIAKLDSLNLLCKGANTFGTSGLQPHLTELWLVLKKEIMSHGDSEVKNASMKSFNALIEVLSTNSSVYKAFIDDILVETTASLSDVQSHFFPTSQKLLELVAAVNEESCIQVLQVVVPICLRQYSPKTLLANKVIIIDIINNFMEISVNFGFSIKSAPDLEWTDEHILSIYLDGLTTPNVELSNKALLGLTIQKSCLDKTQRIMFYNSICDEIEISCFEKRNACYTCISAFATLYPEEISAIVQSRFKIDNDQAEAEILIRKLEALAVITKAPKIATELLPKILVMVNSCNSTISLSALKCLHQLVATKNTNFDIQYFLYNDCNIIDKLIAFPMNSSSDGLSLVSSICQSIVRKLSFEDQQIIINKYLDIMDTTSETNAVIMSLLIPLRENVKLSLTNDLLENLYNLAIFNPNIFIREMSCKVLSVLLNKINNRMHFEQTLTFLQEKIKENLESFSDISTKKALVFLQIWLTKAVIAKGSLNSQDCLNYLASILKKEDVGKYVAQGYKTLTCKTEDILTEDNFCNVKMLYKQRIFQHLLQQNSNFHESSRQNYLVALIYLLDEMPPELLYMHLTELVALLIESLSLDNGESVLSGLTILKLLLKTKNVIFSEKMQSFIPKLLELSTYKIMGVRITALECLTSYSKYPVISINIYKQDVLEKLAIVIDDPKRLVRKAATKSRIHWFLVGSPGGVKEQ